MNRPLVDIGVDIDTALQMFADSVIGVLNEKVAEGRFVRDVFGRCRFVAAAGTSSGDIERVEAALPPDLRPFLAHQDPVIAAETPLAKALLDENGLVMRSSEGRVFRLLDRRLAGEDWLLAPAELVSAPPRFAFYGLKGGVGRSTALAICAADLAQRGFNVLVVDLDVEAPGLGSILLDRDQLPEFGVVDWFAAGAAGIDATPCLRDMIGGSPFTTGAGVVDVVPAMGRRTIQDSPAGFLGKLARVYTPGAATGRLVRKTFTEKVEILLSDLSRFERTYDAILIDVRAGLHETSAAALLGLGAQVFLFGANSQQTINDYHILFASVRQLLVSWPEAPDIRDRFRMVQGKASKSDGDRAQYLNDCWELWLDHFYDEVADEPDPNVFSFDRLDPLGPHYPWVIPNDEAYSTFNPQHAPELLHDGSYIPVFGDFLKNFRDMMAKAPQ